MALSVAVQWLFGKRTKCSKRNNQPKPEAKIKTIKAHVEESSDEFDFISHNEVYEEEGPQDANQEVEDDQKKRDDAEKDHKAEVTRKPPKDLIKAAEENEDILEGREQEIAFMIEDLDEKRLEEFLKVLNKF